MRNLHIKDFKSYFINNSDSFPEKSSASTKWTPNPVSKYLRYRNRFFTSNWFLLSGWSTLIRLKQSCTWGSMRTQSRGTLMKNFRLLREIISPPPIVLCPKEEVKRYLQRKLVNRRKNFLRLEDHSERPVKIRIYWSSKRGPQLKRSYGTLSKSLSKCLMFLFLFTANS